MNIKMYSTLSNFQPDESAKNFRYEQEVYFSTDTQFIVDNFFDETFIAQIGTNSINSLNKNPFFTVFVKNDKAPATFQEAVHFSDLIREKVQFLLLVLWFVKDHSIGIEVIHCYNIDAKATHTLHGNWASCNCEGGYHSVVISSDDLNKAAVIQEKIAQQHRVALEFDRDPLLIQVDSPLPSRSNFIDYNTTNRIDRALNFLSLSRSFEFLPQKISTYLLIYEALFSTDSIEISHQISERVAFYLGRTSGERKSVYKQMKDAYNFRSRYFHGEELNAFKTHDKQKELSSSLDQITRQAFTKIILEDADKYAGKAHVVTEQLREWFKKLIFRDDIIGA